jgi:hypothetical protein
MRDWSRVWVAPVLAVLAVAAGVVAGSTKESAPAPPSPGCSVEVRDEGTRLYHVTARSNRASVAYVVSEIADGAVTRRMEVQYQGSMFMQWLSTSTKDGRLRVHLEYGPLVTGVKVADAWTDDGKTMSGTIDGRPLVPMPVGMEPSAARFVDGRPSPSTVIAPGVLDAVGELADQAASLARTCDAPPLSEDGPSGALQPLAGRGDPRPGGLQPLSGSYDGNTGQLDDPQDSSKCILCKGACVVAGTGCAFLVLKGCAATSAGAGIFAGAALAICLVVGAVVCTAVEVGCDVACAGGGSCCPSHCGNRCCDQDDTCLNNSSELCCPYPFDESRS